MRRSTWPPSRVLAVILGVLLVISLYLLFAGRGKSETVNVNVREGAPSLAEGQNALVTMRGDLLEALLKRAIEDSDLPFQVADVDVKTEATGIRVGGRAATSVFNLPVSAKFSAVVHPQAQPDGSLGVQLTSVKAASGKLPSVFEPALENVINDELNRATRLEGFKVRDVELADNALFVYLYFEPDSLPLGGAFAPSNQP